MSVTHDTLHQRLLAEPATRAELVSVLTSIVRDEVAASRGISGATLRSAVATLNGMKRGFVGRAVDKLLPAWIDVLERHHTRYELSACDTTFGDYIVARRDRVAEELWEATSARVERSDNRLVRVVFGRLERNAKANLTALSANVPRLARVVDGVLHGV